jgi:hypothetical protein
LIKYGIIVAFVTKAWTLQPCIRCSHLQDYMCKYDRSRKLGWQKYTQTTHAHTQQKNCAHSYCVEKERLHAYTKQCTEWYVNIYLCIFFILIIIHIQVVTEIGEVGWVMGGTVCAVDNTFYGK